MNTSTPDTLDRLLQGAGLRRDSQLAEVLGSDRRAAVCREITKLHEETQRGTLAELSQHYTEKGVKGEIVIIVAGLEE